MYQNMLISSSVDKLICVYRDLERVQTLSDIAGPISCILLVGEMLIVAGDDVHLRLYRLNGPAHVNILKQFEDNQLLRSVLKQLNYTDAP